MQSPSREGNPTRVAAHHHKENIANRPWHRGIILCCFAGAAKQDDVDDPFEPSAAPAQHNPRVVETSPTAVDHGTRVQPPATGNDTAASLATTGIQPTPPAAAAPEVIPPRSEGITTNLLDESVTDPRLPLFESISGTASMRHTARDLNLGSPLVTPSTSTSHHALPAPAAAAAAGGSREVASAEDLEPDSVISSRGLTVEAQQAAQGATPAQQSINNPPPAAAAAAFPQQQEQHRSNNPFLNQQHQSTVTAQLMGMQMQQYRAQHPPAQQQQQHKSLEQQQQQQQQQGDAAKQLAPAGTPGAVAGTAATTTTPAPAAGRSDEPALPALFSRSVAGWDSDRTAAAAAPGTTLVAAAAGHAEDVEAADLPGLRIRTSTPRAADGQQQQWQQQPDIGSQRDQGPKQFTSDLPPRSPGAGLKPLSVLVTESSNDASPFVQQQQQSAEEGESSWSVVPMTGGMPPLSPLRIPSSAENSRNLLKLISHNGALSPDLDDSPQSPRASVVGVNNSVINNLLSEDGMPLVPTEPGLEDSLMDPVPETLQATPETPRRVRSFLNLASMSGTPGRRSGSRDQVPETPRTSFSGTWSGTGRDQGQGLAASPLRAGQVVRNCRGERQLMGGTSGVHTQGLRGGFVSDSNLAGGGCNGPVYRRRSTAAGSSISSRDEVGSWDVAGPAGLRAASSGSSRPGAFSGSSSSKFPGASGGRMRRGSTGMECFTPRAGRALLSFSDAYRTRPSSYSGNSMVYHREFCNPSAAATALPPPSAAAAAATDRVSGLTSDGPCDGIIKLDASSAADFGKQQSEAAGSDVDMSAADMAAAASFHMSPPDDPNPSHHNNIVYAFQPSNTTATFRRSSHSYRVASPKYSSLVGEFSGSQGLGGGGSSSSGQAVDSDRGFSTGSMSGSGALFSRSTLAELAKKGGAAESDAGVLDRHGFDGGGTVASQGAASAPLFAAPVQNPVGGQA